MATTPITPHEARRVKPLTLPPQVLQSFNDLIIRNLAVGSSGRATARFTQEEVLTLIVERLGVCTRQEIFNNRWLDVEHLYKEAGWDVTYDGPGFNESYQATFEFRERPGGLPASDGEKFGCYRR